MNFLSTRRPLIEPLEQRIAPALLVNGANLLGGAGNPKTGQTSVGGNDITLVTVLSGEAIVWYDHGALDLISVGPNTSLDIYGNVGAIIANLTAGGQLSNSNSTAANGLNGDVLLANNILGITTHPLSSELGSIGEIITGGSISNLNISGNLTGVYAGNGVFDTGSAALTGNVAVVSTSSLDLNPIEPGIQGSFLFTASTAQVLSGASITNVKIGGAEEMQMFAGNGFAGTVASAGHHATAGQPGGSITNITIENAFIDQGLAATTPSYNILAGSGGSGTKGGAGGSVSKINEINSTGIVDITGGPGGTGSGGAGGAGGSVKSLNMQSVSSAYTIHAGQGGDGAPGGKGGSVTSVNFGGNQLSNGIVVAAPFHSGQNVNNDANDDILLIDSLTGAMVIEQNNGSGTGFTPIVQDSQVDLTTIAPDGTTPVGAVAFYLPNDKYPNIAVAYKNSESLGIFINQGGGIFYTQDSSMGVYTGDTLDATSVALPYAPEQIAAGNFTGDASTDLAVTANNAGQTELLTLAGNNLGAFSLSNSVIPLPAANPVSLLTADIAGGPYNDLFVGFQSGLIGALLSTGSSSGAAFNLQPTGITVGGGILNLDYNSQEGLLLALNGTGTAMTFYTSDSGGALLQLADVSLTTQPGKALVAHFVPETTSAAEPVEVLSSVGAGSRLDIYTQQSTTFGLISSTASTEALKNFVPVIEGSTSGVAAVGGSVEHFAFSQNGAPFFDTSLPFSGKKVNLIAGDGGNGAGASSAAGGAGGEIYGMNVLAGDISVQSGTGGNSINAPAGAGGLIADTPTLLTLTGQTVPTLLDADFVLTIGAGNGGTASGTAHAAIGGAGGAVEALSVSLLQGDTLINSGAGGDGSGGAGGAGGVVEQLKSVSSGGDLDVTAGNGGAAGTLGDGGAGGSILDLTHNLSLVDQLTESPYNVNLIAGTGGGSTAAVGGAGGSIEKINLTLQPANESANNPNAAPATSHTSTDSTLRVTITAGDGGAGATGGAGGALKSISATAVYDQLIVIVAPVTTDNTVIPELNPVTAQLTSGSGGAGSKGAGGAGGAIDDLTLVGISHFDTDSADPQAGATPLVITSGNGGHGSTTGGAGGAIKDVAALNAQFDASPSSSGSGGSSSGSSKSSSSSSGNADLSTTELSGAAITSGNGGSGGTGNGGLGGNISGLSIAVEGFGQTMYVSTTDTEFFVGGNLSVQSGAGGASTTGGKGGAGGSITSSILGTADALTAYGLWIQSGPGGSGALGGGAGGEVTNLQVNVPQNPTEYIYNAMAGTYSDPYDSLSALILAGNGGAATSKGLGGAGGSISQISETKDVNSAINLIQAGNGGTGISAGGAGGSVSQVNTVGLIGQASDDSGDKFGVFQTDVDPAVFGTLFPAGVPQGVFAGRGGTGSTAGLDGSVTSINAYAIAAIGAAANSSGVFAAAEKVANITAVSIGYSAEGATTYQGSSPGVATPTDGFIFSVTKITGVTGTVLSGAEFD